MKVRVLLRRCLVRDRWYSEFRKEHSLQPSDLLFTDHAITRMSQRNLRQIDIDYVCEHGQRFICAGAVHIFLGRRNIPTSDRRFDEYSRLIGTTVLISSQDKKTVLTVYRNRESIRKDRRKAKFHFRNSQSTSLNKQLPLAV